MKPLIAIPCRDMMPSATAQSIAMTVKAGFEVVFCFGGGLPNARNEICRQVLSQNHDGVLMIDSDMVWTPEHIQTLLNRVENSWDEHGHDMYVASGRYYARSKPHVAHSYKDGKSWPGPEHPGKSECFIVDYTGAGFLWIDAYALKLIEEPWFDHSHKQGEDAYFCHKAKRFGIDTWLYPHVTVGHVGTIMYSDPQYEKVLTK